MHGLDGKVALVTGGGSGIGRAISVRFAREGAVVGIFDVDLDGAKETAALIDKDGGIAHPRRVDITDYDAVKENVAALEAEAGPIEVLVNNAGWDQIVGFLDSDQALWKKVIDINYYGPIHLHHAVLPGMVERGAGKVVNIASDAGRVGSSGEAVYAGCKAGVIAFTKTVARELARSGVTLNTVCPGPTETPLFNAIAAGPDVGSKIVEGLKRAIPMGRLAQPADYPGLVAFLASDDANYITGQTISVSGGLTMAG
jgi:2-hydroxycyclohexanecarboxyl-CoA dehydrogenase